MQYVSIKKEVKKETGDIIFLVPALTFKNSQGTAKQKIPHPLGDNYIEFAILEDAIRAVELAGFKYILPDGTKPVEKNINVNENEELEKVVYNALIKQTKDINSSVTAAAIAALAELKDIKLLDFFIEKAGEDNEAVRTSAINSILTFGNACVEKLLQNIKDENWVRRNSVLICLSRLIDSESVNPEKLIVPLIEMAEDKNSIVKTSAITALGKAYKLYKKEV